MTAQDEASKIEGYLTATWAALEAKGATIPPEKNTTNLGAAVRSLPTGGGGGGGDFPQPDLSKLLDKGQLDNLQAIVAAGQATKYLKLGDQLLVKYGSYTMPFEIVGFDDAIVGNRTIKSINLLAYFTSDKTTVWASNTSAKYSESELRSYLIGDYQKTLDQDFVACLADTKSYFWSADYTTSFVDDKLFAPSASQLGISTPYNATFQNNTEGPTFLKFRNSTDEMRTRRAVNMTGTARGYWTRTRYSGTTKECIVVTSSGAPSSQSANLSSNGYVVSACNFVGKE